MHPIHEKFAKALFASGVVMFSQAALASQNPKNPKSGPEKNVYSVLSEEEDTRSVNGWNGGCDSSCNSGCTSK